MQVMLWCVLGWTLLSVAAGAECPDQSRCNEGQTCCQIPSLGYQCCALPQAVCCDDHVHCCPPDTVCDPTSGSCTNGVLSLPWIDQSSARTSFSWEDWEDWLRSKQETQKEEAVENSPEVQTRSLSTSVEMETLPLSVVSSAEPSIIDDNSVPCNVTAFCPNDCTCCMLKTGTWGCCPIPQAVCCADHLHCCPRGKTCNLIEQRCDGDKGSEPWLEKIPAIQKKDVTVEIVPCNQTSFCADGSTCCRNVLGQWACCPSPHAVCCADQRHCCPRGKTCNLIEQRCDGDKGSEPWLEKIPAIQKKDVTVEIVPCNQTSFCADGSTCCRNVLGQWACCPSPHAVCCADQRHCCRFGQRCNLKEKRCDSHKGSEPWLEKIPAIQKADSTPLMENLPEPSTETLRPQKEATGEEEDKIEMKAGVVWCDHSTYCPDLYTCCYVAPLRLWGCCPMTHAVCCSMGLYCCPYSYTCHTPTRTCFRGDEVIPGFSKVPTLTKAAALEAGERRCDGTDPCPEHTTCCRLSADEWGCCPLENAVCCGAARSCCPKGYHCGQQGKCIQKFTFDWSTWRMIPSKIKDPEFL